MWMCWVSCGGCGYFGTVYTEWVKGAVVAVRVMVVVAVLVSAVLAL